MGDAPAPSRRQVLRAALLASTALAGCNTTTPESSPEPTETGTDAPTPTSAGHPHAWGNGTNGTGGEYRHAHGLPTEPSPNQRVLMVNREDGFHFEPHITWIETGGTVTWELIDGSHTTTAYASSNDRSHRIPTEATGWDSGFLSERGETFARTFDLPGVYDYYCSPHEARGMVSTLIVGTPSPLDQPGLEPIHPDKSIPYWARMHLETYNEVARSLLSPES